MFSEEKGIMRLIGNEILLKILKKSSRVLFGVCCQVPTVDKSAELAANAPKKRTEVYV
jgi:uncharacterized metal-binding protein